MTSGLGLELGVYRRDRTQTKRVGRSEEIQFQTRGTNTFVLGFSMASQSLSHVKKKKEKKSRTGLQPTSTWQHTGYVT